jgi:hypothetical protein
MTALGAKGNLSAKGQKQTECQLSVIFLNHGTKARFCEGMRQPKN